MNILINWEKVFPKLDKMSLIKVYIAIVAGKTEDDVWYSNEESISRIAWRYQMAGSTVKYAISELVKKKLIKHKTRGVYVIDKKYLV